jgi:hypothetical protein
MEACKLEDGMVFKVLPVLKRDGGTLPYYPIDNLLSTINRKNIYDDTGYLRKAVHRFMQNSKIDSRLFPRLMKSEIICIYHDAKIKYAFIGKSLSDILKDYDFSIESNDYFEIVQKKVDVHGHMLYDYKSSRIIKRENNVDLFTLLKSEKVYIEDIVKKNNIVSNINILKEEGLYGYLSEVISDERDRKISNILA